MAAGLRVTLTESPDDFDARARDLLASRVEHNVLATVLDHARAGAPDQAPPIFAHAETAAGDVVAAALRTPPRIMLASVMDAHAADALMAAWLAVDPDVPGVGAPLEVARRLGRRWAALTGGRAELAMAEALHTLDRVIPPVRPACGRLRTATDDDRELVLGWIRDFELEAMPSGAVTRPEMVARRVRRGLLHIWEDDGPVALVGNSPPVADVVRLGPVYTPPAHRARGYASSAVAAVTDLALERGARQCALFTDLANPTSNRIYAALGYRRVAEWEEFAFVRDCGHAPNPRPS